MKNILVTGGLGYIGSHTVVELFKHNYNPIIVDDLSNSYLNVLDGIEKISGKKPIFYQTDVKNYETLKGVFQKHTIDCVIHFAAFKAVGESVEHPLKYYENNIGGLINVLKVMSEFEVKQLVFSSSCTVYGEPINLPVTENEPVKPATSPYGFTKQMGENIIKDCKQIKSVALRYFNPVGAHESALLGELPIGVPNNLIPFITQTAIGLREKLTIFGNDYNTPDGTCIRDYIHVCDLALAHVNSINYLQNTNLNFDTINIGTGNGISVKEMVNEFENENKVKLNYVYGPKRAGDVEKVWADAHKAEISLNWKAQKSLKDMVVSAWNWQKKLNENN